MAVKNKYGISVVICCYNSSLRIEQTLKHLFLQNLSIDLWEIILVDNNSTDKTSQIAKTILKSVDVRMNFRIVLEKNQGLNAARIRGYHEAIYDIICFCDDDNWMNKSYLTRALELFNTYPNVGLVGGKGTPVFKDIKPDWFERYENYFACGGQWHHTGNITRYKGWLYGAGFCIRKQAFYANKVKLITTDRLGNSLVSGGDTEIGYLAVLNGWQVWYDDQLAFEHFIAPNRCNIEYLKKLILENDRYSFCLDGLAFRAGYHKGWYKYSFKKTWFYLFLRNLLKLSEWTRFTELGLKFSLKVQFTKIHSILSWNKNYDKSFLKN